MVSLDELAHESPSVVERLTSLGWGEADVAALFADWPDLHIAYADDFVDKVVRWTRVVDDPTVARGWVRALADLNEGCPIMRTGTHVRVVAEVGAAGTHSGLIRVFVRAAGGDQEVAVLGYLAGLTSGELAGLVAAGGGVRDRLQVLAGLRKASGGW